MESEKAPNETYSRVLNGNILGIIRNKLQYEMIQ